MCNQLLRVLWQSVSSCDCYYIYSSDKPLTDAQLSLQPYRITALTLVHIYQ
jgi:hypothetical protein